jgi:hypothetical protein
MQFILPPVPLQRAGPPPTAVQRYKKVYKYGKPKPKKVETLLKNLHNSGFVAVRFVKIIGKNLCSLELGIWKWELEFWARFGRIIDKTERPRSLGRVKWRFR